MVEKAHPGTISSIILSVLVVGILLMPFYMANQRDKFRTGEGEFDFKEVMYWNLESDSDFEEVAWTHISGTKGTNPEGDTHIWTTPGDQSGTMSGIYWSYKAYRSNTGINYMHTFPLSYSFTDAEKDCMVGEYPMFVLHDGGTLSSVPYPYVGGYAPHYLPTQIYIYLDISSDYFVEMDATRFDLCADFELHDEENYPMSYSVEFVSEEGSYLLKPFDTLNIGNSMSVEIDVDDLIEIELLKGNTEYVIVTLGFTIIHPWSDFFVDDIVTFDAQLYGIEEFNIPSIDWMGIGMIGVGMFMTFCSILMLPQITFNRVITKIVGKEKK